MPFYLKLAFRNLFRNRRRTFLTGLIIGVGLAAIMFTDAWIMGMKENMIASATSSFLGEAQIHREGYLESQDSELTLGELPAIRSQLDSDPAVDTYSERVASFGTVSSPADVASIQLYGVDPAREKALSKFDEAMIAGSYLSPGPSGSDGVLLGSGLAERLEVSVGDRVVLTVSRASGGELSQDLFRVSGLFRMHIEQLDDAVALIPLKSAQRLVGIGNRVHEIAVRFRDPQYSREHGREFSARYSRFGNRGESWQELVPQLKYILDLTDASVGITVVIVFAVIIFGIVNTLFMSLYERLFEFGVLRAVGTRPAGIRRLIVSEAGVLALYAILLGVALGAALIALGSVFGLDLTGVELAGATFTGRIYTVFRPRQFLLHPALVFAFTVLVSLYPAGFAGRMSVTRALQRTM
jgi:ABC-type lipoprotein release transport system permease subunit